MARFKDMLFGLLASAMVVPPAPAVTTFIGRTAGSGTGATQTFTNAAIGTAAADRLVVVTVEMRSLSSRSLNSVTIGGVTADMPAILTYSGTLISTIVYLPVAAGTTATIVLNFSGTITDCNIGVYSITGLLSHTPLDADAAGGSTPSVTLDTLPDGAVIANCSTNNTSAVTWGGGLTEDYDVANGAGNSRYSGAHTTPSGTTLTPAPTASGATGVGLRAISWR